MGLMNQKPRVEKRSLMIGQCHLRIDIASMNALGHSHFLSAYHMLITTTAENSEIKYTLFPRNPSLEKEDSLVNKWL